MSEKLRMFPLEVRQHPAFLPAFLTPSDAQQVGSVFFFLEKEGGRSGKAGLLCPGNAAPRSVSRVRGLGGAGRVSRSRVRTNRRVEEEWEEEEWERQPGQDDEG